MYLIEHDCTFMKGALDLLSIKQYIFANRFDCIKLPGFRKLSKINSAKGPPAECAFDVKAL